MLISVAACGGGGSTHHSAAGTGSDSAAARLTACGKIKAQLEASGENVSAAIRKNGQDPAALTVSTVAAFNDGAKKIDAAVAGLSSDDQIRLQAEQLAAFFTATASTISKHGTTLTGLESLTSNPKPKQISTQLRTDCQP